MHVYRAEDRWAIAIERLGYSPSAGYVELEIYYYGNCLRNLGEYNNHPLNSYSVYPIDETSFLQSTEDDILKNSSDANFWLVHGEKVPLSYNKEDYAKDGIELKEYEPNTITIDEAARLAVTKNRGAFRATKNELYKCLPSELKEILVLDEWYHKDFDLTHVEPKSEQLVKKLYDDYKMEEKGVSFSDFLRSIRESELNSDRNNREMWDHNRPEAYETWQLIADVIVSGNPLLYKPTLPPNTHWKNWPESGSL